MTLVYCCDCAHERKQTPATYTIPNSDRAPIPLCDAHAERAGRYHRLTPIEPTEEP